MLLLQSTSTASTPFARLSCIGWRMQCYQPGLGFQETKAVDVFCRMLCLQSQKWLLRCVWFRWSWRCKETAHRDPIFALVWCLVLSQTKQITVMLPIDAVSCQRISRRKYDLRRHMMSVCTCLQYSPPSCTVCWHRFEGTCAPATGSCLLMCGSRPTAQFVAVNLYTHSQDSCLATGNCLDCMGVDQQLEFLQHAPFL